MLMNIFNLLFIHISIKTKKKVYVIKIASSEVAQKKFKASSNSDETSNTYKNNKQNNTQSQQPSTSHKQTAVSTQPNINKLNVIIDIVKQQSIIAKEILREEKLLRREVQELKDIILTKNVRINNSINLEVPRRTAEEFQRLNVQLRTETFEHALVSILL